MSGVDSDRPNVLLLNSFEKKNLYKNQNWKISSLTLSTFLLGAGLYIFLTADNNTDKTVGSITISLGSLGLVTTIGHLFYRTFHPPQNVVSAAEA